MKPLLFATMAALCLLLTQCSVPTDFNFKEAEKIDNQLFKKLTTAERPAKFPILVVLKGKADLSPAESIVTKEEKNKFVYDALRNIALTSQNPLSEHLNQQNLKFQRYYIANMIAIYNASKEQIADIAKREDVEKIYGNFEMHTLPMTFSTPPAVEEDVLGPGSNLTSVGADKVWNEYNVKGKDVVVAGQDTGIDWDHPALIKQYRGQGTNQVDHNYNWHDAIRESIGGGTNSCGYDSKEPCDDNGHGTHTIGTVVGDDGVGNQVGMAPEAKWIGCRNMDAGVGRPNTYIECFEFFLAPYPLGGDALTAGDPTKAPHVINNSWGCPDDEGCTLGDEMLEVVKAMRAAGIMVVAAAGNDGSGCDTIFHQPASLSDEVFSVGALDHRTDEIAYFSSRGPSKHDQKIGPDVTAPGVNIRSSIPGGSFSGVFWSGTSMASPHVVGQVALMWSADKNLVGNITETEKIIRESADAKITTETCGNVSGDQIPNNTFGHGKINAYNAVKKILDVLH